MPNLCQIHKSNPHRSLLISDVKQNFDLWAFQIVQITLHILTRLTSKYSFLALDKLLETIKTLFFIWLFAAFF